MQEYNSHPFDLKVLPKESRNHLMDDENRENPIGGKVNPVPASSLVLGSGGYRASFRLRREATIGSGRVLGAHTHPMGAVGNARHSLLPMVGPRHPQPQSLLFLSSRASLPPVNEMRYWRASCRRCALD